MVAAVGGLALLIGTAIGWALRGPARWCPRCGHSLTCRHCAVQTSGRTANGVSS